MYLDSRGESHCCLFKNILDLMMDSENNWIIIRSCLQQNDGFISRIFVFSSYKPLMKTWDYLEKPWENSSFRMWKHRIWRANKITSSILPRLLYTLRHKRWNWFLWDYFIAAVGKYKDHAVSWIQHELLVQNGLVSKNIWQTYLHQRK